MVDVEKDGVERLGQRSGRARVSAHEGEEVGEDEPGARVADE